MKQIAILLQEFFPADVRVRKEVRALLEAGYAISIFCLQGKNEQAREEWEGVQIYRTSIEKRRGSKIRYIWEYFVFYYRAKNWIKSLIKSKRIDVVHVHTLPDFLLFAAASARKSGAKIILDMHEITPEFFMCKYDLPESSFIILLLKWIERKSIRYADRVITVSDPIKKIFQERGRPKNEISVILNTVDDYELPVKRSTGSDGICRAVYHGTLTKLYNLEFAIRGISKIKDQLSDFEFHIYGSGNEEVAWQKLTEDLGLQKIVIFHGRVAYNQIPDILAKTDIGILPLDKNVMTNVSFSNKIGEYIHSRIAVLSSDLNSLQEYFNDQDVCYYKSENMDDFCNKLIDLVKHPDKRVKLTDHAYKTYEGYTWAKMKKRLLELYQSLPS